MFRKGIANQTALEDIQLRKAQTDLPIYEIKVRGNQPGETTSYFVKAPSESEAIDDFCRAKGYTLSDIAGCREYIETPLQRGYL